MEEAVDLSFDRLLMMMMSVNLHSTMATALNQGSTDPRESVNLDGGKTATLFSLI